MRRAMRILLGAIILIVSCAILIWGVLPVRREIRTQPVSPTELQLPTPASFQIQPNLLLYSSCESISEL